MKLVESKRKKGLCIACRCTRKAAPRDKFCHRCRKRYQKENNPVVYTFGFLKQNAKRRGKSFELTIDQFRQFCEDTNYIELKGKHGKAASIDRIDPKRGYSIDNIQILSLAENASKSNKEEVPF